MRLIGLSQVPPPKAGPVYALAEPGEPALAQVQVKGLELARGHIFATEGAKVTCQHR